MKLTSSQLAALRDDILEAARRLPRGITVPMLASVLLAMGHKLPEDGEDSLDAQLLYLEGKKLIEKVGKAHTPSLETWKLTADGDDYLRQR
jgi:hypothetical protein